MPAFEYLALDHAGRSQRGVLQADNARAARAILRERRLNPLRLHALSASAPGSTRNRLKGPQLALLTRQLATLVRAGFPIDESLQALAEGSEGRLRTQVVSLRVRVMEGTNLATAMAEFPETFPPLFRASVAAGESAGKLDRILLRLADYAEMREVLRRRILLALTYPLLLTTVAIAVVAALMIWVVPQVIGVFLQQKQALPLPTRVLVQVSEALSSYGVAMSTGIAGAGVIATLALRRPDVLGRWHALLLRLPLIGRLARATETARFARTLALLVGSAVPLLDALNISVHVVENTVLRVALARVAIRVREGQPFSKALADTGEFPPVAVRLIASGEKSGRLDDMLFEAAANQERELDTVLGVAMAALGPGVILLVGGLVLFIVLAILLPIFELNTLIR